MIKINAAQRLKATSRPPAVQKLFKKIKEIFSTGTINVSEDTMDAWLRGGYAHHSSTAKEGERLVKNLRYKKIDLIGEYDDNLEDALKEGAFGSFTKQEINQIMDYAND